MVTTVGERQTDRVIHLDVSWQAYETLAESLGDDRRSRLSYNGTTLAIMSSGFKHESITGRVAALLAVVAAEWNLVMVSTRSARFRSAELEKGFEADEIYYLHAASRVRDWYDIDLATDPPPDLVIEVDISGERCNKQTFEQMHVPEFWRYSKRDGVEGFALDGGRYQSVAHSRMLPGLPTAAIAKRLETRPESREARIEWRDWLRLHQPRT